MPPGLIASFFWVLSLLAIWGISRDLRTGVAVSQGWRFRADESPMLFLLVVLSKGFVIWLAVAETGYAMGLGADPILYLHSVLPSFAWRPCP